MVFAATGTPETAGRNDQFERDGLTAAEDLRVHEVIAEWVERRPDAVALRMVSLAGTDVWTYRRLWDRVCQVRDGAFADLPFGSRVVMAQAGDADYVAGFVAALEAGVIPVPLFLPTADAPERFLLRAQHILEDCAPAAIYTSADLADALGREALLDGIAVRTPDSTANGSPRPSVGAATTTDQVGFLQYTSGSTGEPKGIVNTHASMLHQRAIGLALWNSPEEIRTVSWLPLYHDLGIFWGVLLALATGGTATVIPPFDFVRNPRLWLETVHQVRGNWIAGPDFAYRLCLDAFDDAAVQSLDLSCLHLAINGAEPVRPSTLRDFAEKFHPAGLRADVMTPQYGLAEAGLAVSGTTTPRQWVQASFDAEQLNRGRAVKVSGQSGRVHTLVSCGDSTLGWDVRVVDPERRIALPDGEVGEIWVGGTGLPSGYWGRPEQTAETFGAAMADGSGPYLRTGDAGVRHDGELYICGRYRDLIIVAGGNYFPNDIESTVEEARCGVDAGGACAVQPAADEWWLVLETDAAAADLDDLGRVLRRRILAAHQTAPERIIWVRTRVLPRTTSGKIRRRKALGMLNDAKFDVVQEVSSASVRASATELADFIAGLLGEQDLGGDLISLGMTSTMTARVVEWSAARSRQLDFADLYAEPTLRHWQRLYDEAVPSPAPQRAASDSFAMTALQRAYWIGRGTEQPLGGVGCQTYFELGGAPIDPARLEAALDKLSARHPMLRSLFPDAQIGRIAPGAVHAPLRVYDLTGVASPDQHLDEVRARLRTHRFSIETGDTWRVELTRLPEGCILHFAVDLIIADLTSLGILLHDLAAFYRGDELTSVPMYFGDSVGARRQPAEVVERLPECPQLPGVEERSISFRREQHLLGVSAIATLDESCRANGVTRAAVFLAAYELVLRHWSVNDDFLINVTTFGRPPGMPGVIGDFTKTQLYRGRGGDPTGFADHAARTQQGLRAALRAPESTDLLAAQLHAGTGHSGIAPIVFTYAADTTVLRPLDTETLGAVGEVTSMTPQVLIDHQVGALGDDLIVSWDYRAGCFAPGVVADMFAAYVSLLEGLGDRDWSEPVLIALPEHSRLARRRRNTTATEEPEGLLYENFLGQAHADPTRVALRWAGDEFDAGGDPIAAINSEVSYGALCDYARSVAAALTDRYPPGSIIGVRLPKGPAQVVAVLGVLMAGCSYLPVGVDQPAERFARICELSGIAGLIHAADIEDMIHCSPAQPVAVGADDTAYVIYTSGSTGEPKGVLVSHASALNTIVDVNRRNGIGGDDSLLALSALDFDLSVFDIFGPLSCGASVVMISERSRRDAFRWKELITEFGVTVWNSVPALMEMLLIAAGEKAAVLPSLRSVLVSGDWVSLDLPGLLRHAAPSARLVAMGGATEAAIWSNEFVVTDVDPDWASVPYGYPLSNQMFRVVDDHGHDRPDWVAGELWIGGAGVAQGYHNDPDLTAERFVPDRRGRRWYRTGDLGCYWPDGTLQFLGRLDSQVKIGGHRVECGEIEHVLRGHPLVDNAAVVPIHGNTALGAVVVLGDAATAPESVHAELRGYVAARLPQYMTPKSFVARGELPLTGNGKVDRACAAKEVEQFTLAAVRGPAAGLSPVEQRVADVWSDVLGVLITDRADNFFTHGGDSLRATQVVADLKRQGVLGAEVGTLLGRQTLGEFSAQCVVGALPAGPADRVPVAAGAEFALTRLQQAYVLGTAGLNGSVRAPTHFSIVLAASTGPVDVDRFVAAVDRCVEEFEVLRCALDADTSQRIHAVAAPVRVTTVAGADPDALSECMADASLDPRAVPALQCFALSGPGPYIGLLVNYLSLDARSLATVISTIIADYQQLPRPCEIDGRADVFARFAAEQAGASKGPVSPPPALPLGPRRPDSTRIGFQRSSFTLDAHEFDALRDRAAHLRVTANALIFEAFTNALHGIGAGDRFAVVIPRSHRPDYAPADREVLGNFTRLALCNTDYTGALPGSAEAVAAAQQQLWRAVGDPGDATAHLAALHTPGSTGYPVVFTSTLGLAPTWSAGMSSVRTLTQTPGVWLDCQIEDCAGGARLSWDTATGVLAEEPLAVAFTHFERAVRRHAGQVDDATENHDWAGAVVAAAAELCEAAAVRPQYAALVQRWEQCGTGTEAPHDIARAASRLADIVTGAASPQTLIGDPQLAPEAMLLADERLLVALDDLGERVFAHARAVGRRLRIMEVGSRTGLVTQRLTELLGAVVAEYLCFEPNPVLAEIATGRSASTITRQVNSVTRAPGVDVVICCGSLHQLADAGAVLEALVVADDGWLWVAEICEITSATLAGAAVLDPGLLAPQALPAADQWWRFLAQHSWRPLQMAQDGPGLTVVAQRGRQSVRPMRRSVAAVPGPAPAPVVDATVLAAVAAIWQRHLNIPGSALPTATDDFFLLGGDSLVATRVYADLRAAGFAGLALVDLFNYPVLGDLAAYAGTPAAPRPAPTPVVNHDETEFPLTVVQQAYLAGRGGGFLLSGVAAHCYFEFRADDLDRAQFERAARQLIEHHPGLRTTVVAGADRFAALVHAAPIDPVVRDYDDVRARMRDQVIDVTTRPGIEFGVQTTDSGYTVGISMDNIMLDGTSMMIALAQLDHLYRGGSVDELPPLRTSFAQYVVGHPELAPDADESALPQLAASRDHWRARLPSLPPAPGLAPMPVLLEIDRPVFERVEAIVVDDVWRSITQTCRTERVTPAAFLLANYARALAQWSASAHFCINVTLFDRDPGVPGIEDVIGDFTSLLLLECYVDGTVSIWEQARRLQRQLLTDLPHRNANAVWLQRELLRHHGRPASAVFPVVFTSGLGLVDTSASSSFDFGGLVYGLSQTPQTVLDFQMWERAGSLALSWDFVTQAIAPDTARRHLDLMVDTMVAAVASAGGAPQPDEHVERVLDICAAALGVPRVRRSDNFFQLGADSVTATRVVEQLSREVSASATLRLLFEYPVIGEFAERLRAIDPDGPVEFEEGVL